MSITARENAISSLSDRPEMDLVRRFGLTREEIIQAAARRVVDEIREHGEDIDQLVTLPLGLAATWSGLTRDEVRRRAEVIDHGRRNQRITLAEYRYLITPTPQDQ